MNGQKYAGKGLPNDNDYLDLRIPLVKNVSKYIKDGQPKEFISYAQVGSKFGGEPIGDGTLMIKITVYPSKSTVTPSTKFTAI